MGDDEGFEYIYKFVTARAWDPANRAANRDLLDDGTLYVARFNADGTGDWLALVHGKNGLTAANGFASQADVLVKTRAGGGPRRRDADGPPRVGRGAPGDARGVLTPLQQQRARPRRAAPGPDAANPRANNVFGHIIRWREDGDDVAATRFRWDLFALGGVPENADPAKRGRFKGDAFGCPDGLWFDRRGVLWVQTDISPTALLRGRLRAARQQPGARRRPRHRRAPAVPDRADAAARSPASPRRPTTARRSSTSSTRARTRARSTTPTSRARTRTGRISTRTAGRGRRRW